MDLLVAMRVYVRVVERGSMSAAAHDLGMGQPAVSERINRLEQYLGAPLLLRNTRKLSVTDVGAAFYERSRQVLESADDALTVANGNQSLRGTLRIAAPHGIGEVILPSILLQMRKRHPLLKIELILNDRIVDPVTEGVDISLRLGDLGEGSFIARKLGHVGRVLVASPAYLEERGTPTKLDDLAIHPFLRVSGLFNGGRLLLIGPDGQTELAAIDIVLSTSHWRPLHSLLLDGAGIGVLQAPVCAEDLASGRLVRLLPEFTVPGFDLHALYSAIRPVPPRIRAVLSLLEEQLSPASLPDS
ncbi:LysR family transcriptional regulator [Rhizobium sp. P40RR-XXII]|uniref:LysR family transcriptional regulator n=1 Tax=unclassified Rhizobium TaxID=2613769 RepID=UPI001456E62F|nr:MULTISPECIES: LysR family transcriptional regulator [unclassified Rhizobium]NLR87860.1 LysR family transcriptional regulator [Rhizobium sp. P28RR-XV]NLS18520.1 LysR family transcriptional regulator [Rhizobium sp. P40RR-XXII]